MNNEKSFPKVGINWFPGHMAKTRKQITEDLKMIDVVVEVLDARIPNSSQNPDIRKITDNKKKVIVLNKYDLADKNKTELWIEYFNKKGQKVVLADSLTGKGINETTRQIQKIMEDDMQKMADKGRIGRKIRVMIVGIPNVGKSSFINRISKKTSAEVGNKPGVTKQKQWIRINDKIELLDTPGVLWPKFDDEEIGLKLALLGAVRDEVVSIEDIALYACDWMMKNCPEALTNYYQIEIQSTPYETLLTIGRKRGMLQGNEVDEDRLMKSFVKDIRDAKCGRITWEFPND